MAGSNTGSEMKLCIPPLGALIALKEQWHFRLYFESRNATVLAGFLDGSKKVVIPWVRHLDDLWYGKGTEPAWSKRGREEWKTLFASFRAAGFTIHKAKKPQQPEDEVYKSFLTQVPLPYIDVSLPPTTVLAIDRYYIRQGAEAFDSLTFKVEKCPLASFGNPGKVAKMPIRRFWACLQDVNNIECEVLG